MKRVVAVLLVVALSVAAFVPVLRCPDCLGVAASGIGFAPDCPRCGDRGRISGFNRVSRRSLDPDLAAVVSEPWQDLRTDASGFGPALKRLLDRARVGTPAVGSDCVGEAVFAGEGDVVGLFRSAFLGDGAATIDVVFFGRDGAVLDRATLTSASGNPLATLERGGVVRILWEVPLVLHRFRVVQGGDRREIVADRLVVRPRGGRLEIAVDP